MPTPAPCRFSGIDLACIRGGRVLFAGLGLAIGAGGAILVTGPNGVGKSSLLRIAAGLLASTAGRIELDAPDDGALRPQIAYLGHGDALKGQLTVAETLTFWSEIDGPAAPAARAEAVAAAAARFALAELGHLPCRYLSAGQKRRVALARVMAARAVLWILDEPTTALDEAGVRAFEHALVAHRAEGGMALIATHAPLAVPGAETLEVAAFAGTAPADPFYRGLALDQEA